MADSCKGGSRWRLRSGTLVALLLATLVPARTWVYTEPGVPAQPALDAVPLRQNAALSGDDAPVILNTGHDFALMEWPARPDVPVGHSVYASHWGPSFMARFAPDLSGAYHQDGETFDVCTRQDGVLGEGRMAAYLHSEDGGFSALVTGRWDVRQGGYAGVMLHSNDTSSSGPALLYAHKDGWLRLRNGRFNLWPMTEFEKTPARTFDLISRGQPGIACDLLPPRPHLAQSSAPHLTGNYLSNYNESIAICTFNGSLVAVFSGLGYQQGFAVGAWVGARQQWEGTVAEIGFVRRFSWRQAEPGVLVGEWDAYNRTNMYEEDNRTEALEWKAMRDDSGREPMPAALALEHLTLTHLCPLLIAADSGQRGDSDGRQEGEEEWRRACMHCPVCMHSGRSLIRALCVVQERRSG